MAIQLNYQGAAGLDDMGAFNARTNVGLKGDMLFRIYQVDGKLYFIKVGGSKTQTTMMAAQFGLLGGLIGYLAAKRQKKKTQEKLNSVAGLPPDQLLAVDKVNWAEDLSQLSEPALNPGSFWASNKYGSFSFRNAKGKKRRFTFDDADNFQAATRRLPEAFGNRLQVLARWDEEKKKVVKA